jgi:hypothetical protein
LFPFLSIKLRPHAQHLLRLWLNRRAIKVGPLAVRAHGLAALDQPVDFEHRRSVADAKVLANLLDRVRLGKVAKQVTLKFERWWDRAIFVNLYVPSHPRGKLNCKHHGLLLFGLGLIGDSLGS